MGGLVPHIGFSLIIFLAGLIVGAWARGKDLGL